MILIDPRPERWTLGIDTSAYTTSVAVVMESGAIRQARRVLDVELGSRGLRPSEAVFHHVKNLPVLVEQVFEGLDSRRLVGVAVSVAPRPAPDSYLPPFLAGEAVARSIASLVHAPLLRTTHQEGHIRAGVAGAGLPMPDTPFIALHISGGTTELVSVTPGPQPWKIRFLGGSDDLYAGQFVDRIGVLLGCRFPAGPELDGLAEATEIAHDIAWSRPRFHDGAWWTSFSGPESAAERAVRDGAAPTEVARGVMDSIARALSALVQKAAPPGDLLVVGGVAANTHLRRRMQSLLALGGWRVWFAPPEWSRDNAIGVAYLAWDAADGLREPIGGETSL